MGRDVVRVDLIENRDGERHDFNTKDVKNDRAHEALNVRASREF
jgi:hypothetical protein